MINYQSKTVEVPIEWFEGLQNAVDKCEFLRNNNEAEELTYLLGYLDSAKAIIKKEWKNKR